MRAAAAVPASPGRAELPAAAPWLRALARVLLAAAGILHLAFNLGFYLPLQWERTDRGRDVTFTYEAVKRVRAGEALYRPWPEYGPHVGSGGARGVFAYPRDRYPYPPLLPAALSALPPAPYLPFARAWLVVLFAAFWAYAACLAKLATGRTGVLGVLTAGMAVGLVPGSYLALLLANPDPLLWALVGLALAAPAARGAGFALAASVKLYSAWPLLLAARLEGRRVWLPALATLAVLAAVGAAATGPAGYAAAWWDWRHMLPVIGQGMLHPENYSVSMASLRLARRAGLWEYGTGPAPLPVRVYLSVCAVGAPLLFLRLSRRWSPRLRYAGLNVVAVFFAPLAWNIFLPALLAPAAVWWGERRAPPRRPGAEPADGKAAP